MLVDSHCHLDYLERDGDLEAAVQRAHSVGIGTMVTICTKVSEFPTVSAIAERYEDVWCTVGIHPHDAANEPEISTEQLINLAQHPKVIGIGETGLDYYYENSPRNDQRRSFRAHIAAARETGLPLIVHTRDADQDTIEVLTLTNYITAVGNPDTDGELWKYWPANLHMVGKDILRFHAVYWPAFLMAAGIQPPRRVFAHGWWTNEGQKISKSLGNVIDPFELVEKYGLDPVRYFLLRQVPFGNDGDFSHQAIIHRLNGDLANDLGNLCQRVMSMIFRNCDEKIPEAHSLNETDYKFVTAISSSLPDIRSLMEAQSFHQALELIWRHVAEANRYVDEQAPWALRKSDPSRMETVLYTLAEAIRNIAILTSPFMPDSMDKVFELLGLNDEERGFDKLGHAYALTPGTAMPGKPQPIFPRYVEEEGG